MFQGKISTEGFEKKELHVTVRKADPKVFPSADMDSPVEQCTLFCNLRNKDDEKEVPVNWMVGLQQEFIDAHNAGRHGLLIVGSQRRRTTYTVPTPID